MVRSIGAIRPAFSFPCYPPFFSFLFLSFSFVTAPSLRGGRENRVITAASFSRQPFPLLPLATGRSQTKKKNTPKQKKKPPMHIGIPHLPSSCVLFFFFPPFSFFPSHRHKVKISSISFPPPSVFFLFPFPSMFKVFFLLSLLPVVGVHLRGDK